MAVVRTPAAGLGRQKAGYMGRKQEDDASGHPGPWMQLWVSDIQGSCADMTPTQFGIHMRMLLYAWDRGSVPADRARISNIAGIANGSQGDRGAIAEGSQDDIDVVLERWILDGRRKVYTHPRLTEERLKAIAIKELRSKAGARGNEVRWGSQTDRSAIANGSHTTTTTTTTGLDTGLQVGTVLETGTTQQPAKRRKRAPDTIGYDPEHGWTGITEADVAAWEKAYPNANVQQCIAASHQWIVANPGRGPRSAYRRFLTSWMGRQRAESGSRQGGSNGQQRATSHIPEDAHPDDHYLWYMSNGWTPKLIPIYRTRDGRKKWLNGRFVDSETSTQGNQQ